MRNERRILDNLQNFGAPNFNVAMSSTMYNNYATAGISPQPEVNPAMFEPVRRESKLMRFLKSL